APQLAVRRTAPARRLRLADRFTPRTPRAPRLAAKARRSGGVDVGSEVPCWLAEVAARGGDAGERGSVRRGDPLAARADARGASHSAVRFGPRRSRRGRTAGVAERHRRSGAGPAPNRLASRTEKHEVTSGCGARPR